MNIIGHISIGVIGSLIFNDWFFLLGSVIPDISLIVNEINLRFKNIKFNKFNVYGKDIYDITHSVYILIPLFFISKILFISYLIHLCVDVPFHTSSFRWKPFLLNRWKSKKRAVLLSGGIDSIAATLIENNNNDLDFIYFNYGQEYHHLEYPHALKVAERFNKELIVINKDWKTDIPNRNYYLISEVKKMGYDEVIIGTRNLLPLFDKYKDSNWFNLKIYQYLIKIYINMPLIGLFKFQIENKIDKDITYFSTENYHKNKNKI